MTTAPRPRRFKTVLMDRLLAVWQEVGVGEMVIQAEIEFEHPLELPRLRRAVFLLLAEHPVLGCRFVIDRGKTFWEETPGAADVAFQEVDPETYQILKHESLKLHGDCQILVAATPNRSGHRLLVRVSHVASDAGGVREILWDLARSYTQLRLEPDYRPTPRPLSGRSPFQIVRHIPLRSWLWLPFEFMKAVVSGLHPLDTHTVHFDDTPHDAVEYVVRHISATETRRLRAFALRFDATLNDLLVAAWYRALAKIGGWNGGSALRLQMTVDMRRWYLPARRGGSICNLSAYEYPYLGHELVETLEDTLVRVASLTRVRKNRGIGLLLYLPILTTAWMPYPWGRRWFRSSLGGKLFLRNYPPVLTNMGPITAEDVTFDTPAQSAYLLTPPIHRPLLGAGLSGYAGCLTLSGGTTPTGAPHLATLLDAVLEELSVVASGAPSPQNVT